MTTPTTTTDADEWLDARRALLQQEKAATRAQDKLAEQRRALPWLELETDYELVGASGPTSLGDMFDGQPQLAIYHFMYGPDWDEGCPSCSFWADSFDGIDTHLKARGTSFACVSAAPIEALLSYRSRMGWSFRWFSSAESGFNHDMGASFTADEVASGAQRYNLGTMAPMGEEAPGLSIFARRDDQIYLTYQSFARGLEPINAAYNLLDLTPAGRDEQDLPFTMGWIRRHDQY